MADDDQLQLLESLIVAIQKLHSECSSNWEKTCIDRYRFNQRSTKVIDVKENDSIMESILQYVDYLKEVDFSGLTSLNTAGFTVTARIKNGNSILDKYEDYINYRPEKGEVSIQKCFNDLYGIRAIIDTSSISKVEIESLLKRNDIGAIVEIKDVPANQSGYGYKAIHIYFKTDNFTYRWELQVWLSDKEVANTLSHKFHRYKYKNWESESQNDD